MRQTFFFFALAALLASATRTTANDAIAGHGAPLSACASPTEAGTYRSAGDLSADADVLRLDYNKKTAKPAPKRAIRTNNRLVHVPPPLTASMKLGSR